MLQAVALAAAAGQPFGEIFSQQWVLTQDDPGDLPDFNRTDVGAWRLYVGSTLPVAAVENEERGIAVAVMGQAVDLAGDFVDSAVLARHVASAVEAASLAKDLTMLGGRYAVVIVCEAFQRLYIDPSGCLGAVYDPSKRRAAATLFMAIDRPVESDDEFPFSGVAATGAGRFGFARTGDASVRRLLANHYLDLSDFTTHRHWPSPDCDLSCAMTQTSIEERIDTVIARHRAILSALSRTAKPAMLPVSGGDDSRVLLALSADFLDDFDLFFVHRANDISRRDVAIACELASRMKIDLKVLDVVEDVTLQRRPRYARRMNLRRRLALGLEPGGPDEKRREIEVRAALPPGGSVFRGNVTDVSKAVLWRNTGIAEFLQTGGQAHDPKLGVRLMMLGPDGAEQDEWCRAAYRTWLQSLPEGALCRALDFASIEQFRTHGQGALFYATNRNYYQTPSSDRTILEALIALPPHLRDAFYINDLIVERTAPELLGVRFTRQSANEMRARRLPLAEVLSAAPERL